MNVLDKEEKVSEKVAAELKHVQVRELLEDAIFRGELE